jgi:hypothetical protein
VGATVRRVGRRVFAGLDGSLGATGPDDGCVNDRWLLALAGTATGATAVRMCS